MLVQKFIESIVLVKKQFYIFIQENHQHKSTEPKPELLYAMRQTQI